MPKKTFILLLILLVFYLSLAQKIQAETFSASIFPPITKIHATAPVTLQSPIIIKNTSSTIEEFKISFRPFTQSDSKNGQIRFLKSNELDLADPLMFQRIKIFDEETEISSIKLAPQEEKKLSLYIDVPANETTSDYYFSILFTSITPETTDQKNKTDIQTGIATNVLLSIGNEKPKIEIDNFSTSVLNAKGPIKFTVEAQNNGKSFTDVRGFITIKDLFGHTVGRVEIKRVNILAGTSRLLSSDEQISHVVWPEAFLLGPYTADLTLISESNSQAITASKLFIGIPVKLTIAIVMTSILLILIKKKLKTKHSK